MTREEDIQEIFIRSSGPGGQNVNKVSTAVMLCHIPSGLRVKCQKYRSQYQNRVLARELLTLAVNKQASDVRKKEVSERELTRRRNRLKPKILKLRILENKKKHSIKKNSRRPVQGQ